MTDLSGHRQCAEAGRHVCQKPSGRPCHEQPCSEAAGTLWGPHWCPDHDSERLRRIDGQLRELSREMETSDDH